MDLDTQALGELRAVVRQLDLNGAALSDLITVAGALRLESGVKRKIWPGPEGMRIVALAGVPGEAFTPKPLTELGASDPYTPAAA